MEWVHFIYWQQIVKIFKFTLLKDSNVSNTLNTSKTREKKIKSKYTPPPFPHYAPLYRNAVRKDSIYFLSRFIYITFNFYFVS